MQPIISNKIEYIVGNKDILRKMTAYHVRSVMNERVIEFFHALSRGVQRSSEARGYVDLMSYAFWVRQSHLEKEKVRFADRRKMGRGVSFHVTPSNVPVNFAVSMTSAALAGNACILRVSSKPFEQVRIITDIMKELLQGEFVDLEDMFCIIRYEHDEEITRMLSALCDIRIIWGGDATIQLIRCAPLKPRAVEMTFPDRHSVAVIQSDAYLEMNETEVAELFYTDTYYSDQNACSSPKIVVWMGKYIEEAKKLFWKTLREKVEKDYIFSGVMAIDKLDMFCRLAMKYPGIRYMAEDNICVRVELPELSEEIMEYKMYGGYFFEYTAKEFLELLPLFTKECQTVSCLGIEAEKIMRIVEKGGCKGVDRIVPMGHTMDLSFFWDGYDMIDSMSRYVVGG